MRKNIAVYLIIVISALQLLSFPSNAVCARNQGVMEWVRQFLGLGESRLNNLSAPRFEKNKCNHKLVGMQLVRFDFVRNQENVLWESQGCWSPVPLQNGAIAVATEEGLWLVYPDGEKKNQLVYPLKGIEQIIGQGIMERDSVLVLVDSNIQSVNLKTGKVTKIAKLAGHDLSRIKSLHPSAEKDGKRIITSYDENCSEAGIRLESIDQSDRGFDSYSRITDPGRLDFDRFDPAWYGNSRDIIYVRRPGVIAQ